MHKVTSQNFATVIRAYLASPNFHGLKPATQAWIRRYLMVAEKPDSLGGLPIGVVRPSLVQDYLDGFANRPGAQKAAQGALRFLEKWAVVRDKIPFPITTGTEIVKSDGGHMPWTDTQVAIAEHHARPEISRFVTLAANTGQRGSDLVRMRWTDIETFEGHPGIKVMRVKNADTVPVWIPFTEPLRAAIATWERRPGFILTTIRGLPYANRKSLWGAWSDERDSNPQLMPCAGLVPHGLRATAIIRLRRAGCTPMQISDMVVLSLPMVERYCRFADQRKNALAAVYQLRTPGERSGLSVRESLDKTTG